MSKIYSIKEIFYTLQGEGYYSGRAAVFIRFSGCNLWSGLEKDRENGPGGCSKWCDTDFVGTNGIYGGKKTAQEISAICQQLWSVHGKKSTAIPFAVLTGGEPLLQVDEEFISEMKSSGFYIAVETNGTIPVPRGIDWICVSPKANTNIVVTEGNELKFVFPQEESCSPFSFENMNFNHFYIQPKDDDKRESNTIRATGFCLQRPNWRLCTQLHKALGIK